MFPLANKQKKKTKPKTQWGEESLDLNDLTIIYMA